MTIYELFPDGSVVRRDTLPQGVLLSCAFGCFDGVHLGHAALLRRAVEFSEQKNASGGLGGGLRVEPAVWTFSEPLTKPWLFSVSERLSLCGCQGIKYAVCEDFASVRGLSPSEFVDALCKKVLICHAVCGFNFRFGLNRSGSPDMLRELLVSFSEPARLYGDGALSMIDRVSWAGETVSSSRIRLALSEGDAESACAMLGRPYSVIGSVLPGKQRGRTVSLPTVNLSFDKNRIIPKHGVYYTVCRIGAERRRAVTNVGFRPTVNSDGSDVNCEAHILDFDRTVYGESAEISFLHYARPEMKFSDLDGLAEQIRLDIIGANEYFDNK